MTICIFIALCDKKIEKVDLFSFFLTQTLDNGSVCSNKKEVAPGE